MISVDQCFPFDDTVPLCQPSCSFRPLKQFNRLRASAHRHLQSKSHVVSAAPVKSISLKHASNFSALPPLVVENSDKVEHLILDGNNFTEYFLNTTFSNLRTLSLNTNRIRDVAFLLQLLAKRCPKLSFLSLIGNPGWPHQFSITDVRLYKEYTCCVAKFLPRLEFLDSFQISAKKLLAPTCRIS